MKNNYLFFLALLILFPSSCLPMEDTSTTLIIKGWVGDFPERANKECKQDNVQVYSLTSSSALNELFKYVANPNNTSRPFSDLWDSATAQQEDLTGTFQFLMKEIRGEEKCEHSTVASENLLNLWLLGTQIRAFNGKDSIVKPFSAQEKECFYNLMGKGIEGDKIFESMQKGVAVEYAAAVCRRSDSSYLNSIGYTLESLIKKD